jgi:hypothetical protein
MLGVYLEYETIILRSHILFERTLNFEECWHWENYKHNISQDCEYGEDEQLIEGLDTFSYAQVQHHISTAQT